MSHVSPVLPVAPASICLTHVLPLPWNDAKAVVGKSPGFKNIGSGSPEHVFSFTSIDKTEARNKRCHGSVSVPNILVCVLAK